MSSKKKINVNIIILPLYGNSSHQFQSIKTMQMNPQITVSFHNIITKPEYIMLKQFAFLMKSTKYVRYQHVSPFRGREGTLHTFTLFTSSLFIAAHNEEKRTTPTKHTSA